MIILLSDRVVTIWLVTGRDIILEFYLGDIARRIILLLLSGHVTACVTVSPDIILLLFYYYITGHVTTCVTVLAGNILLLSFVISD